MPMNHTRHYSRRWILSLLVVGLMLLGVSVVLGEGVSWPFRGLEMVQQRPLWGLGAVLGVFFLGIWGLPKWQVAEVTDASARVALETEARKTLVFVLGGGLLLAGLYLIWGTLQETRRLLESSQYHQPARHQEQRLDERLARATDQLGAMHTGGYGKHLEVRLSGIYALERIAQESPPEYWAVMDLLTAYARANPSHGAVPAIDLETVFTVLKRRSKSYGRGEDQPLNLRAVEFRSAPLGDINLAGAILMQADLSQANLARADLRQAKLTGARLGKAVLTGTLLAGADLRGADLQEADLRQADLTGANLQGADLSGVDLTQAVLEGVSLKDARLHTASLKGVDLRHIALDGASLQGADLRAANLSGANLAGNSFHGATLASAIFAEANLQQANLLKANCQAANLTRADLRRANLQEANLASAVLRETNLREATLSDVKNLSQEQFDQACTDDRRPKWPFNLTWPSGLKPSPFLPETCQRWEAKP
jgi:uncharacterized protein YjbI with pentapeptide repeats